MPCHGYTVYDSDGTNIQRVCICLAMGSCYMPMIWCYSSMQDGLQSKGVKVNMNKTKILISRESCM